MQIQNDHIRLLPKKIKDLQCIRREQEKSIAMLTKELEEINRTQRETYGMVMEEAATKLRRGRKRKVKQSTSTKVYEDNSKHIEGVIMTNTTLHKLSQENTTEVTTTYGDLRAGRTITQDEIGFLYDMRNEKNMPLGCQLCEVIDTGLSNAYTDNNLTLHICRNCG
jgi:hypothetical protein